MPLREADKLPYLTRRFRVFLRRLERTAARVRGGAGDEAVPAGELSGDAPSVRAAVAGLLEAEGAAAQGEGFAAGDPELTLALWLMARCGDAAFTDLPGWGGASAPLLESSWPPPPELSPDPTEQVEVLLDAEVPDPHRAELYLLALAAGGGDGARIARLAGAAAVGRGGPPATPSSPLFPAAYPAPRRHGPAREVPPVARWVTVCLAVAAGLLLTSWLVWAWAVGDLERLLHHLLGGGG